MDKKRIIVGISGASGIPVAVEVLRFLGAIEGVESHLVYTHGAELTIGQETDLSFEQIHSLADVVHDARDVGASIASGSFRTAGMVVVPCSMKTVAGIHSGYSDNLLLRAADVTLKERRRLVLAVRETPLSGIHLRNMAELTGLGAIILPLVLTYYDQPRTVEDMTRRMAGKILDLFDMAPPDFRRWSGQQS